MNNEESDNKNNWYSRFIALSSVIVFLMGVGAFGYGAIKSISDSIKKHRAVHAKVPSKPVTNAVPFNSVLHKKTEMSK